MIRSGILLACVLCVITAGCLSMQLPDTFPATNPLSSPGSSGSFPWVTSSSGIHQPSIIITSPEFDGGVLTGNVTVITDVGNFIFVPPGGKKISPDPDTSFSTGILFLRPGLVFRLLPRRAPGRTPQMYRIHGPGSISPSTSLIFSRG